MPLVIIWKYSGVIGSTFLGRHSRVRVHTFSPYVAAAAGSLPLVIGDVCFGPIVLSLVTLPHVEYEAVWREVEEKEERCVQRKQLYSLLKRTIRKRTAVLRNWPMVCCEQGCFFTFPLILLEVLRYDYLKIEEVCSLDVQIGPIGIKVRNNMPSTIENTFVLLQNDAEKSEK